MTADSRERIALGRRLIASARRLTERKTDFHKWMIAAPAKLRESLIKPIAEGDRVVAVDTPLGRFTLVEELARQGGQLVARLVFYMPAAIHAHTP